MSQVFFTADLHLGHAKIVELSHRPFNSIEEHDQAIYNNWFKAVNDDDIVWVLGDVSIEGTWKHALDIIRQLPGRKRLMTGNHDQVWVGKSDSFRFLKEYQKVFEVVTPWARAKVNGKKVLLSHFPYEGDHTKESRHDQYRLRASETPLIHGHTHSTEKVSYVWVPAATNVGMNPVKQVHVGVDSWDYRLVKSQEVFELL